MVIISVFESGDPSSILGETSFFALAWLRSMLKASIELEITDKVHMRNDMEEDTALAIT
ncbi:unnamed protein product [Mucor hiemalis]